MQKESSLHTCRNRYTIRIIFPRSTNKETPSISRAELSKRLKICERQVRKITDQLQEKGVLIREGGNSGKWVINKI
ncbi:MAG: Rrf2 family transcriptional regulator [Bacteroidales bacterium]|nr:Rrf2 family transcriptional regulator [Bacteroidales bacterium]